MNLIAAVDRNWAIGNGGRLLASIPDDRRLFREDTAGKVVIMGRKTLESLPGEQPLRGRTNLVLSRDPRRFVRGAVFCRSVEETLRRVREVPPEDVYVIGGGDIYRQFLPYCDTAHITYIDYRYRADTYMRNLDRDPAWRMDLESEEFTCFDLCYTFRRYVRTEWPGEPRKEEIV